MAKKIKFLFFFLLSLTTSMSFSKISISVDSWNELICSMDDLKEQVKSMPNNASSHSNQDCKKTKSGLFDEYINRIEDKFDVIGSVLSENKKFLKLTGFVTVFIYCYYINPYFLQNLVEKSATTAMRYLSLFVDSLFKGALGGIWENKGVTSKIVGGLMIYSIFNNIFSIGIRSMAEYYIAGRKQRAVNEMDKRFGKIK